MGGSQWRVRFKKEKKKKEWRDFKKEREKKYNSLDRTSRWQASWRTAPDLNN